MAANSMFQLEGFKEVEQALKQLPAKTTAQLLRSVNRKALSQEVVKQMRNTVPYSSKTKKAIKIVSDKSDKTGVLVGPTSDAFWIRFQEKGTEDRHTGSGARRGKITGRPRIAPLIDSKVDKVVEFFKKEYVEYLIKFMQKKIRKLRTT